MKPEDRLDAKLDSALEMTFPASDPFTIHLPEEASAQLAPEIPRRGHRAFER